MDRTAADPRRPVFVAAHGKVPAGEHVALQQIQAHGDVFRCLQRRVLRIARGDVAALHAATVQRALYRRADDPLHGCDIAAGFHFGGFDEPAHHHIERTLAPGQGQIGQRDFHGMEETRHEKTPAERDLVDLGIIQRRHPPPPQSQITNRRLLEIQLFEKRRARILSGHGHGHPDGWPATVQDRIAPPRWRSRRPRADRDVPP